MDYIRDLIGEMPLVLIESEELDISPEQLAKWKAGELIPRAMPNLTPAERELLISGYCGGCWDKLFEE